MLQINDKFITSIEFNWTKLSFIVALVRFIYFVIDL